MANVSINVKNYNFGYFLKEVHVKKALELINFQLSQTSYSFKSLDFELYRKEKYNSKFNVQNFYNNYVRNDILYNHLTAFNNKTYQIPKGLNGVRDFDFLSFYSTVVYYAIGFYIYEIINLSLKDRNSYKEKIGNVYTTYGGDINFESPPKSKIYYRDYYRKFNLGIKKYVKENRKGSKLGILKLDIQSFYNSINHTTLLSSVEEFAYPKDVKKNNFDNNTKESIQDFLFFLKESNRGIPLSSQNIISNFLSDMMLVRLDDFIIEELKKQSLIFSYHRYVDDFFILIKFSRNKAKDKIGELLYQLGDKISTFLATELKLTINPLKSRQWVLSQNKDEQEFLKESKFISFSENENMSTPNLNKKLKSILNILKELKNEFSEKGTAKIENEKDLLLKEIFSKSLMNLIKSNKHEKQLKEIFKDFNPILTLHSIKTILFITDNSKDGFNSLIKYLNRNFYKSKKSAQFMYLLERTIFLDSYTNNLDKKILEKDDNRSRYFSLIKRLVSAPTSLKKEYLSNSDFPIKDEFLIKNPTLIQQIKKSILAEKSNNYNLAFNHILNAFHFYCYIRDNKFKNKMKYYNRENVKDFLQSKKISLSDNRFVISFFDRRNNNTISHPGDENFENWVVTRKEFLKYKNRMNKILRRLEQMYK
ncbi:MAG: hypothetical protein GXO79_00110 [Chlorobi bacterium]|nr:hypothetical protein [Chlorobiota bacterium]